MANFKQVNNAVKKEYPAMDIVVYRGQGYVYFDGLDGENIESIYSNPTSTSTKDMIRMVLGNIGDYIISKQEN